MFSKIKKFLQHHVRSLQLSLAILLLASVFFVGSLVQVYGQKRADIVIWENCKSSLNSAKTKGIPVDDLICPEASLEAGKFFNNIDYRKVLDDNNQIIAERQTGLEINIKSLENQIQETIKIITASTLADPIKELGTLSNNQSLKADFDYKNEYYKILVQLKNKQIEKVKILISDFKKTLEKFDPKLKEETDYISSFEKQDENYLLTKYPEIQTKFKELQVKLSNQETTTTKETSTSSSSNPANNPVKFKTFSGVEFQNLYETITFPKSTEPINKSVITGDIESDAYIAGIAENRGYKKRQQAIESGLQSVEGQRAQSEARQGWLEMKQAARKDGINLGLISGYRSVNNQKDIFFSRFQSASKAKIGRNYTPAEIVSGNADSVINQVLETSSIPGYSRHHNGYTFDVTDLSSKKSFTQFKDTAGYRWISANNYYNAKRFGFIPSYPVGIQNAGPNPEAWEYVWVGTGRLVA